MEKNVFLKLKPLCFWLRIVGLAPFYFDEHNNMIYSTFHIKIVCLIEILAVITSIAILISSTDVETNTSVTKALFFILAGVFVVKIIVRNAKGIFFSKSGYSMWVQVRKTLKLCDKRRINYHNSSVFYMSITGIIAAIIGPPTLNSLLYVTKSLEKHHFVSTTCVYLIHMPYLSAAQEFCYLISLMAGYFKELDLILNKLTKSSKLIKVNDGNLEIINEIQKCYFSVSEAAEKIVNNFALPVLVILGEVMILLLIHSHNVVLLFYGKSKSVFFVFNPRFTVVWVSSYLLLLGQICGISSYCQRKVSFIGAEWVQDIVNSY